MSMLSLQKNYLEKYQQIYPENHEWNTIEYKLQLSLGDASVELKNVYCVANPQLCNVFERENKVYLIISEGMIISEVYIKPSNLTGHNRIERVCQKGFELSDESGMEFTIGKVDNFTPTDKEQLHDLLLTKICPRRIYPCIYDETTSSDEFRLPNSFDSIYFKETNPDSKTYKHKFKLFKKMQTLPYYLIRFGFNSNHEKKFKKMMCQNCDEITATHYCVTEGVYFCAKCDYQHHKDKISNLHERNLLNEKQILDFGECIMHKQNKNEIFCRECNKSMCMSCKIYGSHAEGPMAKHKLEKINDYFDQITKEINVMDPNLIKRKDQFRELLYVIECKIDEINSTTTKLQEELSQMFTDAMTSLKLITKRKLCMLIADQLEVKRQYDYIQWMESFLRYEFNVLPPNNFLASWTKHLKLRKEVLNVSNIPAINDVKANFKIYGKVRVFEDDYQEEESEEEKREIVLGENEKEVQGGGKEEGKEEKEGKEGKEGKGENERKEHSVFKKRLFGTPES